MPTDAEITFSDHMGRFYARRFSFAPMVGRLIGYLAVCDPPNPTIGELAEALLASRSAIAGAVKVLETIHVVQRSRVAGERMDRVRIDLSTQQSMGMDVSEYEEMGELAPLDLALVPIAGWGPRLGPGHMDAARAARAVALLGARVVVPIHWGTLHPRTTRLGRWFTSPADVFVAQAAELAPDSDVRVLQPGESTSVTAPAA